MYVSDTSVTLDAFLVQFIGPSFTGAAVVLLSGLPWRYHNMDGTCMRVKDGTSSLVDCYDIHVLIVKFVHVPHYTLNPRCCH